MIGLPVHALRDEEALDRDLDAQVAASNHNVVRHRQDLVDVVQALYSRPPSVPHAVLLHHAFEQQAPLEYRRRAVRRYLRRVEADHVVLRRLRPVPSRNQIQKPVRTAHPRHHAINSGRRGLEPALLDQRTARSGVVPWYATYHLSDFGVSCGESCFGLRTQHRGISLFAQDNSRPSLCFTCICSMLT
jgi:hypothetical protein